MNKAKYLYLLFLLFSLQWIITDISAQDCNYQQFMLEGRNAFDHGDYQLATNKFKAAKVCCSREQIAECEAEEWIIRSQETYVNALQAEKEKLELAAKVYRYAVENPTHAFRIAEYALGEDPSNDAAREQYLNLLATFPFPFYANALEHLDYVSGCAIAPDASMIATASWDNQVRVWNATGQLQLTLTAHDEPVLAVAFSPDNQSLISAGMDDQIIHWDLKGNIIKRIKGHTGDVTDVAFINNGNTIASCSWDGTLRLWDSQGNEILSIAAHDDFITDLAYTETSKILATAGWDKSVKLWDLDGNLLQTLKEQDAYISSVDFSQDGKKLLTASWDARVLMWEVSSGQLIQEFSGHTSIVHQAVFSPKDDAVLTCADDNTVRLWNMHGNEIQTFHYHSGPVLALAFSPDDEFFVTGGTDTDAAIWYYQGTQDHIYHFENIRSIADLTYDAAHERMLFAAGTKAYLSDMEGNIQKTLEGHPYDIVRTYVSSGGNYLATGALDVYLWDGNGDTLAVYRKHRALIHDVAIHEEKKLVVSGGRDDVVCVWNFQGETIFSKRLENGLDVTRVAFVPNTELVAATTSGGKIFLLNPEGEVENEITATDTWITAMTPAPDGNRIAMGDASGLIRIYSLEGALLQDIHTQHSRINSLDFSPDGRLLIIGGENGGPALRNEDARVIQQLIGHRAAVNRVLFTDQNHILSASNDGTVRRWSSIESLLNDRKVYTLSGEERLKYGFAIADSMVIENDADEVSDPDDNPLAKIGRQVLDTEKSYFESGKVLFRQFTSFYYSKKAHQSRNIEEKIALQRRAIRYHDVFVPEGGVMDFQKSYFYTKLFLWYLGASNLEEAKKNMEKALSYELSPSKNLKSIKSVRNLRQALLQIYLDNWEAAEQLIRDNINIDPHEGSDQFVQLYYLTSNLYLPEGAKTQYQLLEDIDFLESVGAGHPDFEKVRALLRP